jgi:hypothetical protein
MRNLLLIIITPFLFNGCFGSPFTPMTKDEIIENRYISFNPPNDKWLNFHKHKRWKKSKNILSQRESFAMLSYGYPGTTYDLEIETYPSFEGRGNHIFFDNKNEEYSDSDKVEEVYDENDKETGLNYRRSWVTYINGLKCTGGVFSRSGGMYVKFYNISCGYYDKTQTQNNGKRIIGIEYRYNYASGYYNSLQKDKGVPISELLTHQQAEDGLKQAVKELVKTIKIKNIDIKRMEKEGLIHYDKEFKSTKW